MEKSDNESYKEIKMGAIKKNENAVYTILDELKLIATYSKSTEFENGIENFFILELNEIFLTKNVLESDLIYFFKNCDLTENSITEALNLISRKYSSKLTQKLIETLIVNPNPQVRYDILQIIGDKKMKYIYPKLKEYLNSEKNLQVKSEILLTLNRLEEKEQ